MKKIASIIISMFLFASCDPEIPVIPNPPIVAESAVKDLEKTQGGIDTSLNVNKKIEEKIKSQQETILEQKIEIQEALANAEKIKAKAELLQQVTKEEAFILVEQIKKVGTRNLFLENKTKELSDTNQNQLKILEQTRKDAQETLKKLILKENEANELRTQNEFISANLQQKNDEVLKLNKELENAKVYKKWVIGMLITMVIFFILFVAMKIILKNLKPI